MSKRKLSKQLLIRYFTGDETLSEEEEREVGKEISTDPFWLQLEYRPDINAKESIDWSTEEQLGKVTKRIQPGPPHLPTGLERVTAAPRHALKSRPRRSMSAGLFLRIAAVFLIAATTTLLAVWMWPGISLEGGLPSSREFVTTKGQQATIPLSDGTRIRLNADSRLTIISGFGGDRREVAIEGEAYFEVAGDAERPFVVQAGHAVVQVLGTAFNVLAYPQNETVQVLVAEGTVSLREENQQIEEGTVLGENSEGRLHKGGSIEIRTDVDVDRHLGWTQGRLRFQDTPFGEVVQRLERWYDLEIRITDKRVANLPLTAEFGSEPLHQVLEVIAHTLQMTYEVDGRRVTFFSEQSRREDS